jgi:hypothetical protein
LDPFHSKIPGRSTYPLFVFYAIIYEVYVTPLPGGPKTITFLLLDNSKNLVTIGS